MFRELRAYVKEGVRLAQSFCLPLRACGQLVTLATAQLLCDDEEQAQVGGVGIYEGTAIMMFFKGTVWPGGSA
jgi:hypothetical protein